MRKLFGKNWPADLLVEIVGSFLTGIAICNFAVPAAFPMTGFSGLALILYRLFSLPIGLMTLALNIPVALLCRRLLGRQFFAKSLRCMAISSLFVDWVAPLFPLYQGNRMLAAVCTGVIGGLGYAMIYMRNSSTGGTDFVVMALKALKPHWTLGSLIFLCDALVVTVGGILFRDFDGVIYGLIIDYLFAFVADKVMYGLNAGKLALIVTNHGQKTADRISELCGRGTTLFKAKGGYTGEERDVLMCACSGKDMLGVEKAVKEADPMAFTVILESNEVMGEGFRRITVAEKQEKA